jgi:branched-chain amino acid transport system substrate-binding protein
VLVAALALTGCGSGSGSGAPTAPTSSTPVRSVTLWVDLPLAGVAAEDGRQMLDAVRLIVSQASFRVGNIGVEVRASDDADPATGHSDPTRCSAGAARAAADRTAIAVIGTYESACTELAEPTLSAAGLALVSPVNTDPGLSSGPPVPRRTLILLAPSDALQGTAAAAEARSLGAHRLFVLRGRSARAASMRTALVAAAPANGVAIVGGATSPADAAAAAAIVVRLHALHADAVWIGAASGPGVVALLRALEPRTARARALKQIALIGSDELYRDGLVRAAGNAAENLHVTSAFVPPEALGGAGADFTHAFARRFGEPGPYAVYAADAARLVLAALRRSNGTRAGVMRALRRTRTYGGLIGTLAIEPDGTSSLARIAVLRVHDGAFQLERVLDLAGR